MGESRAFGLGQGPAEGRVLLLSGKSLGQNIKRHRDLPFSSQLQKQGKGPGKVWWDLPGFLSQAPSGDLGNKERTRSQGPYLQVGALGERESFGEHIFEIRFNTYK